MSEYFKYLTQLLALSGETFEEELRCLGFSTVHLEPMEVLSALQHAELRLGHQFTKEEFSKGKVGQFMLPEDFDLETTKEKLLRDRQADFNQQLQRLAEPLGVIYDKTQKTYEELPENAPVFDVDAIINLDATKLKTEVTGEKINKEIQEWLLTRVSSQETACSGRTKCNASSLGFSTNSRSQPMWKWLPPYFIKTTLAGTATQKFTDTLESAFGTAEPIEQQEALEEVIEEPEEEIDIEIEEASTSKSQPKHKAKSAPVKSSKSQKTGTCALKNASVYYPTTADKGEYLHAGIPKEFYSKWKSSTVTNEAGYNCNYSTAMKDQGKIVPNCDLFCSNKSQLSTHIRQMHLGVAISCFICDKVWWSASTWEKTHAQRTLRT